MFFSKPAKNGGGVTSGWSLTGNAGTTPGTNFIGTTDAQDLVIKTNNGEVGRFLSNGTNAFIVGGTSTITPQTRFQIDGGNFDIDDNATSGTTGVITKSGTRFLHNYGAGGNSIFLGKNAGNFTATGYSGAIGNIGIGANALLSATTAEDTVAIGLGALQNVTTGQENVAVGNLSMNTNSTGSFNVAVGRSAGRTSTGTSNVFLGYQAGQGNTGSTNVAVGRGTLLNASGANNTAIGYFAGQGVSTGAGNLIASSNGAIGTITTGSNNIQLGNGNTGITTGSGNVTLGRVTGLTAASTNTITIADGVGNKRINITGTGLVGINTVAPNSTLDIAGRIGWTTTSTAAAAVTLDSTSTTWVLTLAGAQTVTLPAVSTNTSGVYVIVNPTATVKTISAYTDFTGASVTTIPANNSITVQSDGTIWRRII